MSKQILILGGYGNTGQLIAELLLKETDVHLQLAGRNLDKALNAASKLNRISGTERVSGIALDASDEAGLRDAFRDLGMVIVASSTAQYVEKVATAALKTGTDYLDVQYSHKKIDVLESLSDKIKASGRCFITDGGFHPGLPAAMIRYAAPSFDRIQKAAIGSIIQIDWGRLDFSMVTMYEFISEIMEMRPLLYRNGNWEKVGMRGIMAMDFGEEFGKRSCFPMFLEEMRIIPKDYPSIDETGFYVGGFNWFIDWFFMPIALPLLKFFPQLLLKPLGYIMLWGLQTFSKPPFGTILKLEATGEKEGALLRKTLTVYHEDGYMLTAAPVVACILQYLNGSINKPGLWYQANIVEPSLFFNDLKRFGVIVTTA